VTSNDEHKAALERIRAIDKEMQKLKREREKCSKIISKFALEEQKKSSSSQWIPDIYQ
jgi:hypothetical protein